jgi:hypothetical protein
MNSKTILKSRKGVLLIIIQLIFIFPFLQAQDERGIDHIDIFHKENRYGGWPANYGIWSYEDEIVVGFETGYLKVEGKWGHPINENKPVKKTQARSKDGGKTWSLEYPEAMNDFRNGERELEELDEKIIFTHPDFAMTFGRASDGGEADSWFYYSYDRGESWKGPYKFPKLGMKGVYARTDYIINGQFDCMVFLTGAKSNSMEGRPYCARTTNGGLSWEFVSFIGPEPENGFSIMPSTIRLPNGNLYTVIRRLWGRNETATYWLDSYLSKDNGETWQYVGRPAEHMGGNPPSLVLMDDGRLCLTYGYRSNPYGIRAKVSNDNGQTWGEEIVLRKDGGNWDIGYPCSVQRPDGKIVTVYYFNEDKDAERYISATIWETDP